MITDRLVKVKQMNPDTLVLEVGPETYSFQMGELAQILNESDKNPKYLLYNIGTSLILSGVTDLSNMALMKTLIEGRMYKF